VGKLIVRFSTGEVSSLSRGSNTNKVYSSSNTDKVYSSSNTDKVYSSSEQGESRSGGTGIVTKKREKLYLVDGSSYIFRAFYAIQSLSTSNGQPTNAIYGFIRMVQKLIKEEQPDKLAIIFDCREPTFRDEIYSEYKANRKEPPDDLIPQFPYFNPVVEALGITNLSMAGYEADDILGTIAERAKNDDYDVVIVTGDKDLMQLVDDHVTLYDTMKERWIGSDEVKEKFGVLPNRVVDVMSLMGDSSDNIPGVSGVGVKSAMALIQQFGDLENLLQNIDKVTNTRARNALKGGLESAELSRKLVTIKRDVPIEYDLNDFVLHGPDPQKVKSLFSKLEFFKLVREMVPEGEEKAPTTTAVTTREAVETVIVSQSDDLKKIGNKIRKAGEVAIYLLPYIGFGLSWNGGAVYIPIAHETLEEVANADIDDLRDFFDSIKGSKKIFYGLKETLKEVARHKLSFGEAIDDLKLMAYVLNPAYPDNLPALAQQLLGEIIVGVEQGKKKKIGPLTVRAAAEQAGQLAGVVLSLWERFSGDLKKVKRLDEIYREMEMPLSSILMGMEAKGISIDVPLLDRLSIEYAGKIRDLEAKIFDIAGEHFAITSPKQLSHILFEKLGLPAIKKTKTGYSTDASVLAELSGQYELPRLVLEYRSLTKLTTTYINVLPTLVSSDDKRIHTTFNQAVTATGRLSSSDPNLQNIPIRSDDGKRIRQAFVAGKGMELVSADYSQIELRILAHISEEPALINDFEKGVDVHSATAARIFGVPEAEVNSKMRGAAKTVNFGVLYGQSAFGLSKQLDIEMGEADAYIKNYYESYPRVKDLKEKILEGARQTGYVETLYGRRRYVPDVKSSNKQAVAFAERMAFNAVFQGTAADIIKMAMITIDQRLSELFPKAPMLLQVHDELIFESEPSDAEKLIEMVRSEMCGVIKLRVPLTVDVGRGKTWADC